MRNELNDLLKAFVTIEFAVSFVALVAVCIVASCVIQKVRTGSAKQSQQTSDMLTNFRDLHAEGHLSDDEYRTIRTKLAAQIQQEIKDNGRAD
jgi:uncharacterized membrane protein